MTTVDQRPVDRTTLHRIWRLILVGIGAIVATACYFFPVLLVVIGVLLVLFVCARLAYRSRDRFIPNLYTGDTDVYDDAYRTFIRQSLTDLRGRKIKGHTLLWEASQLAPTLPGESDALVLDLGVWIGWSTRLTSEVCARRVYGFDTFSGLVEDWQLENQVVKSGTFSLSHPLAEGAMRLTGVTLQDGVPAPLGRDVQFIKGSTYETLAPFLAECPGVSIGLFHMDLDTYESCLHALETCKDHFAEGSVLVFDEYLVTSGEMRAFFEFQSKYELEWRYRAWGLEIMEMNLEMIVSPWKRFMYYLMWMGWHWGMGDGSYIWAFFRRPFWRFWLGAPAGDIAFMLGAAGQRKSVSLEITGLGKLDRAS
ncbi:MAG: class I SAM-dependent methyltransferase [Mycobacteriaceae bacterium]|nr:class I SAM-dependent methyltransferase [Mycobacteriaceae bacterium]